MQECISVVNCTGSRPRNSFMCGLFFLDILTFLAIYIIYIYIVLFILANGLYVNIFIAPSCKKYLLCRLQNLFFYHAELCIYIYIYLCYCLTISRMRFSSSDKCKTKKTNLGNLVGGSWLSKSICVGKCRVIHDK